MLTAEPQTREHLKHQYTSSILAPSHRQYTRHTTRQGAHTLTRTVNTEYRLVRQAKIPAIARLKLEAMIVTREYFELHWCLHRAGPYPVVASWVTVPVEPLTPRRGSLLGWQEALSSMTNTNQNNARKPWRKSGSAKWINYQVNSADTWSEIRGAEKKFARAPFYGAAYNLPDDRRRAGHCFVRRIAAHRQRRPQ